MPGIFRWLAIAAMLGIAAPVVAQSGPLGGAHRFRGVSFALARYNALGSLSLYAARAIGPGFVLLGAAANPHTGSRVGIIGAGTDVHVAVGSRVMLALAGARATDGYSLRLYVLPRVALGRVVTAATVTSYLPLGGRTRRRLTVDPLTVVVRATPVLRPGLALVFAASQGRDAEVAIGPTIQLRVAGYQLALDVLPVGLARTEARVTVSATF